MKNDIYNCPICKEELYLYDKLCVINGTVLFCEFCKSDYMIELKKYEKTCKDYFKDKYYDYK